MVDKALLGKFQQANSSSPVIFTGDKCVVNILQKLEETYGCVSVTDTVTTLGVFDMEVDGVQSGMFLVGRIEMHPSDVARVTIDNTPYIQLTFKKGDTFIKTTNIVIEEKLAFIAENTEVQWDKMEANKDGTFGKSNVNKYIASLQMQYVFPEDSLEARILEVNRITEDLKLAKKEAKQLEADLEQKTIELMPSITDEQIEHLLYEKWIHPLFLDITHMPINVTTELSVKVDTLTAKYADTLQHIEQEKAEAEITLASLMDNLTGNVFDMQGLKSLQKMLKGE